MTDQATSKSERTAAWEAHRRAPKFLHITRELEGVLERESYVYSTPDGAIELWRKSAPVEHTWNGSGYFGGVEVHSPKPLYANQSPRPGHCAFVWGDSAGQQVQAWHLTNSRTILIRLTTSRVRWHPGILSNSAAMKKRLDR